MLSYARRDVAVVDLRGNVETRLRHAEDGTLDAVILAEAGLRRLGLGGHVTERLGPPRFLPAVGQGALGLECRADDAKTRDLLAWLDDAASHRSVVAERTLLAELHGGCLVPLGAWARVEGGTIRLDAAVLDPEGRRRLDAEARGEDAEAVGRDAARRLLDEGAGELLASIVR
jgi:hydroxymethylbilane synthase